MKLTRILLNPDAPGGAPTTSPVDPRLKELANDLGVILTPDGKIDDKPPVPPVEMTPVSTAAPLPLGERAAMLDKEKETKPPETQTPPVTPPETVTPPVTTTPPPPEGGTPNPPVEPAKPPTRLVKVEATAPPPVVTQPPTAPPTTSEPPKGGTPNTPPATPPAAPATPPVDPFEASLTPEQKEELEAAAFAEKKFGNEYANLRQRTLEYFKKVDDYAVKHSDLDPGSDEFKRFVESNRPKMDRRKVERAMIIDEAETRAEAKAKARIDEEKAKMDADLKAVQRKQYLMEVAPVVNKSVEAHKGALLSAEDALPDGVAPIDTDVAKAIQEKGIEAAYQQFPIEAPIVHGALAAGETYLRIVNGVDAFDPNNPMHSWTSNFLHEQGQRMMQKPEADRKDEKGRSFVPFHEYAELKPAEAAKHWTFSDIEVLGMIRVNAHLAAHAQTQKFEQAGWKREKSVVTRPTTTTTPPVTTPAPTAPEPPKGGTPSAPKAGTAPSRGAAAPSGNHTAIDPMMEVLLPGSSQRLA